MENVGRDMGRVAELLRRRQTSRLTTSTQEDVLRDLKELLKTLEKHANVTHHHHVDGHNAAAEAARTVREVTAKAAESAKHVHSRVSESVNKARSAATRLAKMASVTGSSNRRRYLLQEDFAETAPADTAAADGEAAPSPDDASNGEEANETDDEPAAETGDALAESEDADQEATTADEEQDENVPMTSAERRAARHRNVHDPDHSSTRDERDEGAASGDDAAEEGGATDEADSKPPRASSVQIPERGDVRLRLDSEVISAAKHASDADGGIVDIEKLKSA